MATLRGPGAMKQVPLIAVWSENQITKNKEGQPTGAYLDVQVNQSGMTQKAAKEGKADSNPHIESHQADIKGQQIVSHTVWYSQQQMEAMQSVGTTVQQENGKYACAFGADLMARSNPKDPSAGKRVVVLLPKDLSKAATPEDAKKIEEYNAAHPVSGAPKGFNEKSLAKQEKITSIAKSVRAEAMKAKSAEKAAAKDVEAQAEAPEASDDVPPFGG